MYRDMLGGYCSVLGKIGNLEWVIVGIIGYNKFCKLVSRLYVGIKEGVLF